MAIIRIIFLILNGCWAFVCFTLHQQTKGWEYLVSAILTCIAAGLLTASFL